LGLSEICPKKATIQLGLKGLGYFAVFGLFVLGGALTMSYFKGRSIYKQLNRQAVRVYPNGNLRIN
ncbi:MAG: hypothetical protein WBE18_07605, partial [Gammaproteobacteria bacterium]